MRLYLIAILLYSLFIVNPSQTYASTQEKLDSLKALLVQHTTQDSLQWSILHSLCRDYAVIAPDSAILYGQSAIQLATQLNNKEFLFKSYNATGVGYIRKQAENKALQYFLLALNLAKSQQGKQWQKYQAQARINISGVFWTQNDTQKALQNAHLARLLLERLDEPGILADNYHSIGLMHEMNATLDSAIFYLSKSLKIYKKLKVPLQEGRVIGSMGDIYLQQHNFNKATSNYKKALTIAKQEADIANMVDLNLNIANVKIQIKEYKAAKDYVFAALAYATSSESFNKSRAVAFSYLSTIYNQQNRSDSAFYYLKKQHQLEKQLLNIDKTNEIAKLHIAYQSKEKELENELLRKKNLIIITRERNILIISSVLLLGILIIGYFAYKLQKQNKIIESQKEKVEKLLEEKSHLISLITHDIQTPLSLIQFTVSSLLYEKDQSQIMRSGLESIELAAQQISYLGNQINEIQKIKAPDFSAEKQLVNVADLIKEASTPYLQWAQKKNIKVEENIIDTDIKVKANPLILSKAFGNVLGNAIKFSQPGKKIKIKLNKLNEYCLISIKDNGPGISPEDRKNVFKQFQKLTAKPTFGEPSTGNGLYLAKRYIEVMGGGIDINSNVNKGSEFIIKIPIAI